MRKLGKVVGLRDVVLGQAWIEHVRVRKDALALVDDHLIEELLELFGDLHPRKMAKRRIIV